MVAKNFFTGKHSGKAQRNQQQLEELLNYIRERDTVVVTKFDRLGRSLSQLLHWTEVLTPIKNLPQCPLSLI
ncbi:recombinase family protein [Exercitatus varius]|uniref:recombinase family protein n=1 Tax=Exercitatus varius TaxID=67857 RepID=UPI00294B65D0|nr:recombinase family protein [Exercitatus varius]MDG2961685.1 recombinase family protein [Exercitatus varius]